MTNQEQAKWGNQARSSPWTPVATLRSLDMVSVGNEGSLRVVRFGKKERIEVDISSCALSYDVYF